VTCWPSLASVSIWPNWFDALSAVATRIAPKVRPIAVGIAISAISRKVTLRLRNADTPDRLVRGMA
jgi:hypothetical protein